MRKVKKAFTLIELIVVIAIIAVLAAVIAPQALKAIDKARATEVFSNIKAIRTASLALRVDTGYWPHQGKIGDSDLIKDVSGWSGWDGPYLDSDCNPHPWGGTYSITSGWTDLYQDPPNTINELTIEVEDERFSDGENFECPLPLNIKQRLDDVLDDGNQTSGNFQYGYSLCGNGKYCGDAHWVLEWDFCPTHGCW